MYDGENTSSRLLGNFTNDNMMGPVINSTSNRLWLEFNSNASGTNQGFRLTYTSELFFRFSSAANLILLSLSLKIILLIMLFPCMV